MNYVGAKCTESELQDLVNEVDVNERGQISKDDFISLMGRKLKDSDTEDELIDLELEFDKLNSLTDLKFLEEKKDLWNKFELTSNNPTLITLLYLNKVNKKKSYIDYVPLGLPSFSDEEKYSNNKNESINHQIVMLLYL